MFIENKIPVIVLQKVSVNNQRFAHFRVVKGYKGNSFYINDSENINNQVIPEKTFIDLWKRQENGENEEENVFVVIYPKDYKIDLSNYINNNIIEIST